MKYNNSQAAV